MSSEPRVVTAVAEHDDDPERVAARKQFDQVLFELVLNACDKFHHKQSQSVHPSVIEPPSTNVQMSFDAVLGELRLRLWLAAAASRNNNGQKDGELGSFFFDKRRKEKKTLSSLEEKEVLPESYREQ